MDENGNRKLIHTYIHIYIHTNQCFNQWKVAKANYIWQDDDKWGKPPPSFSKAVLVGGATDAFILDNDPRLYRGFSWKRMWMVSTGITTHGHLQLVYTASRFQETVLLQSRNTSIHTPFTNQLFTTLKEFIGTHNDDICISISFPYCWEFLGSSKEGTIIMGQLGGWTSCHRPPVAIHPRIISIYWDYPTQLWTFTGFLWPIHWFIMISPYLPHVWT